MYIKKFISTAVVITLLFLFPIASLSAEDNTGFTKENGRFLLNGQPFVVKAAELHYPRIPQQYWEHRILMSKALGMNTICIYVFWNYHEQRENEFDFAGEKNIRQFIELCQKHDMKVILRPGPYVCAEWDMGGLPWWLLKKDDIKLRENDPYFLERVEKFEKALADEIADLTIDKGEPIIMIQVENEYGAYNVDKGYLTNIQNIIKKYFGDKVMLFQCDWSSNFLENGLDDTLWTLNFGTGAVIDEQFKKLKSVRPDYPLMCSEYWSGWFDKWGANHETRPANDMIAGIEDMLSRDISFSLYMTHGGTNWGHWAGANSPGFAPDVTSYDYDAPINEQGAPTEKYLKLRETMLKYTNDSIVVPEPISIISIPEFSFSEVAPLFDNLSNPKFSRKIRPMEEFDQGYGSILYSTNLPSSQSEVLLTVNETHDFAQVFLNKTYIGKLDRRLDEKQIMLPKLNEGDRLDILVEGMGRINYGRGIKDYKGVTDSVTLTGHRDGKYYNFTLNDWTVYNIPDEYEYYKNFKFEPIEDPSVITNDTTRRVGIYRALVNIDEPGDTYLNFEGFGKGLVYVNGKGLGRIWEIGPQQSLYTPGVWLNKGENEILVFDIVGPSNPVCRGDNFPTIDKLNIPVSVNKNLFSGIDLMNETPAIVSSFQDGKGWKEILLEYPVSGRYICLEVDSSLDSVETTAISEIEIMDKDMKKLSRDKWKVIYVQSEDTKNGNRTVDKMFDLQESTFWSTETGLKFPHYIVIDLGDNIDVRSIHYLPRMEMNSPGAIKDFKIYIKDKPFKFYEDTNN